MTDYEPVTPEYVAHLRVMIANPELGDGRLALLTLPRLLNALETERQQSMATIKELANERNEALAERERLREQSDSRQRVAADSLEAAADALEAVAILRVERERLLAENERLRTAAKAVVDEARKIHSGFRHCGCWYKQGPPCALAAAISSCAAMVDAPAAQEAHKELRALDLENQELLAERERLLALALADFSTIKALANERNDARAENERLRAEITELQERLSKGVDEPMFSVAAARRAALAAHRAAQEATP